ncbi:MAG TPA: NAD(P)/FAD-dependent oxidoreductase [Synechococcales cyanobacterium M55_K2018_004]|nr:NAD(P)/FAD-dependent oxidoreductase [Synechococcales cyanobacterium M55_K2018_004]
MTQHTAQICILGGGFGGLYTALRLSQFPWDKAQKPEIVLVDKSDRFLFSPLLYELVTGELETWEIAPQFADLLANTEVRFRQAEVARIDLTTRTVYLQGGDALPYDQLVLALGGETPREMAPGSAEYALPFRTIHDVYQLKDRLRQLEESNPDKIRVAIVGAGYSGVELACKLADRLGDRGRIRLVEVADQILRNSPDFNREVAQQALAKRGVWIDLETRVTSVTADTLSLEYRGTVDTIPVDIVLWTVGTQTPAVVRNLPLKQNDRGKILVTTTLQAIDHPEIYALGDLAECIDADGQKVPPTAQTAFQQADYVAWNLWAAHTGRPLLPFRYQHFGEMLTLGTNEAAFSALGIKLSGPPAYVVRRLAYLYRLPTFEHQVKVGLNWITRPLQDLLLL